MMNEPHAFSIVALTEGYILTFFGKQVAARTAPEAGRILVKHLKEYEAWKNSKPANAVVNHPPAVVPTAPVAAPVAAPVRLEPPAQASATPTSAPAVDEPRRINLDVSRANLANLVRRRVNNEFGDVQYYAHCATYCPGLDEGDYIDALDSAFDASIANPAAQAWVEVPGSNGQVQAASPGGYKRGAPTPGMNELINPSDLVENWVTDDTTGQPIPEGRELD